jgi:four helix bundle protein
LFAAGAIVETLIRMKDSSGIEFCERALRFTCDIFDFCEELAAGPGMRRRVAYQLFDAVSSIGANLEEAKAAYSDRDFASKNSISLKEARESKYWLRVANAKSPGNKQLRERLLREADEWIAMLTTGMKNIHR